MSQTAQLHDDTRHVDTDEFRDWCDRQAKLSRSMTARVIMDDGETIRFRIREGEGGAPEDIVLIKGDGTDTIRFEKGDDVKVFHAHRRDITLHEKTLIVRHESGAEMYRAGTGTPNKRGPFPV